MRAPERGPVPERVLDQAQEPVRVLALVRGQVPVRDQARELGPGLVQAQAQDWVLQAAEHCGLRIDPAMRSAPGTDSVSAEQDFVLFFVA